MSVSWIVIEDVHHDVHQHCRFILGTGLLKALVTNTLTNAIRTIFDHLRNGQKSFVRRSQGYLWPRLNPKTAGGGLNQPPPRHFARPFRRANFFDRAARWLFTFKSRASYDTIFAKIGHTATTLHDLLYMLVRPKMAQKRDFVYKVNVNGVFSSYS